MMGLTVSYRVLHREYPTTLPYTYKMIGTRSGLVANGSAVFGSFANMFPSDLLAFFDAVEFILLPAAENIKRGQVAKSKSLFLAGFSVNVNWLKRTRQNVVDH